MNPPFIENCAAVDMVIGFHHDAGPNSMLIRISDPAGWLGETKHQFKEVHHFEFLDVEKDDKVIDEAMKISDAQAEQIVALLKHALANRMNVIVHCFAGVCRSGAVAEVGTIMGFNDCERWRSPNLLVKHKLMKVLGLTYDDQEEIKHRPYLYNEPEDDPRTSDDHESS